MGLRDGWVWIGRSLITAFGLILAVWMLVGVPAAIAPTQADAVYEQRPIHNPDGIGKFYLGREIAQVMGHQGAGWLERSGRDREERPQRLIDNLGLKPTDTVADIGAGTGYFSFRIAPWYVKARCWRWMSNRK